MKIKLVENIEEKFDSSFELDFDIDWLLEDTDDEGKASGTFYLYIDDAGSDIWEFIESDPDMLTSDLLDLFSDDDAAWEAYLRDNFESLIDKYEDDFRDKYRDKALEELYDNWDSYSDIEPYSQYEADMDEYRDLVYRNLGLR